MRCTTLADPEPKGQHLRITDNIPVAKTTETPSFRFNGMCKDDIQNKGIMNMARSETTLISEEATMSFVVGKQRPGI